MIFVFFPTVRQHTVTGVRDVTIGKSNTILICKNWENSFKVGKSFCAISRTNGQQEIKKVFFFVTVWKTQKKRKANNVSSMFKVFFKFMWQKENNNDKEWKLKVAILFFKLL